MSIAAEVRCDNVTIAHGRTDAVTRLSGSFERGSLTAITGPNGAGKTTLLRAIMGELPLRAGSIVRDVPLRAVAYLPQASVIDRRFPISVQDAILPGLWHAIGRFRAPNHTQRTQIADALEAVGLAGVGRRRIDALSAGQFQRVLFARLLLQDAQVILLDEPFAAIDERTTADLLALVRQWHAEGRTIIAVLHDLAQIRQHFPQTLLLAREAVAWGRTALALSPENSARAKTLAGGWDAIDAPTAQTLRENGSRP